ncbi:MAG TPA: cytochrome c3 family protein [Candidatus Krumholzibacteria bacterium]|nr:cytochrome c3 family protein [Candidatus Krumholzibacteria bacterium]HPD73065.1 cytochrome c3 family protein [Candidatus Krumholzibacteria bacterium]HRY41865.1 cytochrome c3 family protein [Candidatus Krumholzibacteria bacterium]
MRDRSRRRLALQPTAVLPLALPLFVLWAWPLVAADRGQVVDPGHATGAPHAGERLGAAGCAECHTCVEPTRDDPCLIACPRHGSHFFGTHEADEGPDIVVIDQLANLYGPVIFAHQVHAGMAAMSGGCVNCHHYSEVSGEIPPCRSCHGANPQTADLSMPALKGAYHRQCINCHLDWSHENACGFCHEQAGEGAAAAAPDATDIVGIPHPRIAATETYTYQTTYAQGPVVSFHHTDHVDLFGQQCVDCHRGDSCKSCHAVGAVERRQVDHVVTCFACHGERKCAFCHSQEPRPRFDHRASAGWNLEPFHTKVACTTCHGQTPSFRTPTGECADCHIHWKLGSFDHRVTGLVLNEAHREIDCENCHLDRAFQATPSCEACHDEPMLPQRLPGSRVSRR